MLRHITSRRVAVQALVISGVFCNAFAATGDDINVSVGVKAWHQDFKEKTNVAGQSATSEDSATSPILFAALRHKNYFVTVSHLFETRYDLDSSTIQSPQDRTETDIGVGWYFHPQAALTLGYKMVDVDLAGGAVISSCNVKFKVPLVGLSGTTSFSPTIFGYANGAVSFGTSVDDGCGPAGSSIYDDLKYATAEVGVGYRFDNKLQFTAGYRVQRAELDINVAGNAGESKDTGQGVFLGAVYSF